MRVQSINQTNTIGKKRRNKMKLTPPKSNEPGEYRLCIPISFHTSSITTISTIFKDIFGTYYTYDTYDTYVKEGVSKFHTCGTRAFRGYSELQTYDILTKYPLVCRRWQSRTYGNCCAFFSRQNSKSLEVSLTEHHHTWDHKGRMIIQAPYSGQKDLSCYLD